jgi:hypothetical protein
MIVADQKQRNTNRKVRSSFLATKIEAEGAKTDHHLGRCNMVGCTRICIVNRDIAYYGSDDSKCCAVAV